jgi:hypothetical protein
MLIHVLSVGGQLMPRTNKSIPSASNNYKYTCKKCGYSWKPKNISIVPKSCPKCKQYDVLTLHRLTGELNGQWMGDSVSLGALHDYIRYHFPKPDKCSNCGEVKQLDLANISQEYKRDLSDWEWICRKCHMYKDGRLLHLRFTGHHTASSKEKISNKLKGRPKSEEWKAKIRGRKHTPETISKMKAAYAKRVMNAADMSTLQNIKKET